MSKITRIDRRFAKLKEEGRPGLVTFVTAGDPDFETSKKILLGLPKAGADVIELGMPFSDPMADGMTIQRSSFAAIENGVTLTWIFDQLDPIQDSVDAPLIMMSYMNPLLAFGYAKLASRARETGVCAFIVPDLPYEESAEISAALDAEGVGLIQLVTPATPADRLKLLAGASRGFLYAVTVTGITGSSLPPDLAVYLDQVSAVSSIPVCAGFGIRTAEDVRNVGKHAAGAIVGSALVEVLERGEDPAAYLRQLR